MMELIIFDITGKFAHFRKFFTNSSSLSYSVPPRTTVEGLLAAILGRERDSYYEEFSRENLHIGIRKMGKTRKIIQTVNYMKATGTKELVAPKEHTQIPFEIVTGDPGLHYRVYVSHEDAPLLDELEDRVKNSKYFYPPYLGAAPFGAVLTPIARVNSQEITAEDYVLVTTLIRQEYISACGIKVDDASCLVKEKMPTDFDTDRRIKTVNSYIYDENGRAINVKLNAAFHHIKYGDIDENILFL